MKKEELKNILDDLTISEIKSFEIIYTENYDYGYNNQEEHIISYNK